MTAPRWLGRSALAIALAGCGRLHFDAIADATTTQDSSSGPDSLLVDAPTAWSTPTPIGPLADPSVDEDPYVSSDLLEFYFASERTPAMPGANDIFMSMRATPTDPWGPPIDLFALSSALGDNSPALSADGLTIWFSSNRGGTGFDLYQSTRPATGSAWTAPTLVVELSASAADYGPTVDASGLIIMFDSGRLGTRDLFIATRPTVGSSWNAPTPVAELNTNALETDPELTPDGLTVLFASDRPGTMGARDLYIASRPDKASPFGPAVPISELESTSTDTDPSISMDQHYLVFSSDRSGNSEIYETYR